MVDNAHRVEATGIVDWIVTHARNDDWAQIREICWKTSSLGPTMPEWRRETFGAFWTGPYQSVFPDWTWVLRRDLRSQTLGYITVAPDTCALHKSLAWKLRPRALKAALKQPKVPIDLIRHLRRELGIEKGPEQSFGDPFLTRLYESYPAHLHMNLVPESQSKGGGRALIARMRERLMEARISGVHLFCGEGPLGFYRKCEFEELGCVEFGAKKTPVYCLGWSQNRPVR